jgi:hypothetical protein
MRAGLISDTNAILAVHWSVDDAVQATEAV